MVRQLQHMPWPHKCALGIASTVILMGVIVQTQTWLMFRQGKQAYQQANCVQAISTFDRVIDRLASTPNSNMAEQAAVYKSECEDRLDIPDAEEI